MKQAVVGVIIGLVLSGCSAMKLERLEPLDASAKTIVVPPGGGYMKGAVKRVLRRNGWTLYAGDHAAQVSREKSVFSDDKTAVESVAKSWLEGTARYSLWLEYTCNFENQRYTDFDISIIDRKTGKEAMTLSGRLMDKDTILETFEGGLNGKDYDGWHNRE